MTGDAPVGQRQQREYIATVWPQQINVTAALEIDITRKQQVVFVVRL
jgi:hypothetical protein